LWFNNENTDGNITEIKLLFWQAAFYEAVGNILIGAAIDRRQVIIY